MPFEIRYGGCINSVVRLEVKDGMKIFMYGATTLVAISLIP
nr:hypothetical protein [Fusobacterium necrophorum]